MPHVLITGASSGIGAALAVELAQRGWDVGLVARRREQLEAVAALVRAEGRLAVVAPADVLDRTAVAAAVRACVAVLGPVDLAVANAGGGGQTPSVAFDAVEVGRIIRLNFDGVMYTFEAVLPAMVERGQGHIAAVASVAGLLGMPPSSAYSASKAAVQVQLQAMNAELRPRGVAVTVINPGFVKTPLTDLNDFPMPFCWPVERAVRVIADGLERRKRVIEFPFQLAWLVRAMRWLPATVVEFLLRRVVMR
jgi:short-subunit dehydrogenase